MVEQSNKVSEIKTGDSILVMTDEISKDGVSNITKEYIVEQVGDLDTKTSLYTIRVESDLLIKSNQIVGLNNERFTSKYIKTNDDSDVDFDDILDVSDINEENGNMLQDNNVNISNIPLEVKQAVIIEYYEGFIKNMHKVNNI